jgi:hypothetical protein
MPTGQKVGWAPVLAKIREISLASAWNQEIPYLLWNTKVHFHVHKSLKQVLARYTSYVILITKQHLKTYKHQLKSSLLGVSEMLHELRSAF